MMKHLEPYDWPNTTTVRVLSGEGIRSIRLALIAQGWYCSEIRESVEGYYFAATPPTTER